MVSDMNYCLKVAKRICILALIVLLLYLVLKLSVFYMPFVVAFVLALFFEPVIKFCMRKCNWSRLISAIVIISISVLIIIGIIAWGVSTLFNEANNLLSGSNEYYEKTEKFINGLTNNTTLTDKLPAELKKAIEDAQEDSIQSITDFVTNTLNNIKDWISKLPNLIMAIFFMLMALFFMCTDKIYMIDQLEHHLPDTWTRKLARHLKEITASLGQYLRAEATLIFISFVISLIGFTIYKILGLNIPYPLISAIGICFVDALPILGSGAVMVPWAIISAINGDVILGIAILALWAVMGVVRNLLEPKLVSKHIGIHPVITLVAMYTGNKIIGVLGMIIGPILLIIFKDIFSPWLDKGVLRAIFDR